MTSASTLIDALAERAKRLPEDRQREIVEALRELIDQPPAAKPAISSIFGIGASAEPTDIGCEKDVMLGQAVWDEHVRKARQFS